MSLWCVHTNDESDTWEVVAFKLEEARKSPTILAFTMITPRELEIFHCAGCRRWNHDGCRGENACHGCMSWCLYCGDVQHTCQFPTCQTHHCAGGCGTKRNRLLSSEDWTWTCEACERRIECERKQREFEHAEEDMLTFEASGDRYLADRMAIKARELEKQLKGG